MDSLFLIRTLTAAINAMKFPTNSIVARYFAGKANLQPTDRFAFDLVTGSEGMLRNIKVVDPADVDAKTAVSAKTVTAPRLANKRFIPVAELNALRAFGEQLGTEMLKTKVARELLDMRNKHNRTMEIYAAMALRGIIYDSDLTTELVNFGFDATHTPVLTGNDLWSDYTNSDPLAMIRSWKRLIEVDSGHDITGWYAYCGYTAMDHLLAHTKMKDYIKYTIGDQVLRTGRIAELGGVQIQEYNGSWLDDTSTRKYLIEPKDFVLIGEGSDVFDMPYAPIVDADAPGGVGNVDGAGKGQLWFAKSWDEKDPSGRWIKAETRPLPLVLRPAAIVRGTVLA